MRQLFPESCRERHIRSATIHLVLGLVRLTPSLCLNVSPADRRGPVRWLGW